MTDRNGQQPAQPSPTPEELLTASLARWASTKTTKTITGARLLRVLRLLGSPGRNLGDLTTKAQQTAKDVATSTAADLFARRRAAGAAQKAVEDAYSEILRDADTVFTALTGIPADTEKALDLDIQLGQLADDARLLLAVTA